MALLLLFRCPGPRGAPRKSEPGRTDVGPRYAASRRRNDVCTLDCSSLDTVLDSASGLLGMSVTQSRRSPALRSIAITIRSRLKIKLLGHEDRRNLPAPPRSDGSTR